MATRRRPAAPKSPTFLSSLNANFMIVSTLVTLLVSTGITINQFQQIQKNQEMQNSEQKLQNARLTEISNKQIVGLQDIATLKTNVQTVDNSVRNLDGRVLVIERTFIEPSKKMR